MASESDSAKFLNTVNERFSYRGFLNRDVSEEDIQYILECARLAPSAANKQPWRIHIVRNNKLRKDLHRAYTRNWFLEAPVLAVFTGIRGENWTRRDGLDYLMCDVTIIADYFMLAATDRGLGTCYIAAFDDDIVRNVLDLPENEIPYLMTPLGYPNPDAKKERMRKGISDISIIH
jgi:nitroreductase